MAIDDGNGNVFLESFLEIWMYIAYTTIVLCATTYFLAGCRALLVFRTSKVYTIMWIPFVATLLGGISGFMSGGLSAVLIAAIYTSIPTTIPVDYSIAIGTAQAIIIIYLHLGRTTPILYRGAKFTLW